MKHKFKNRRASSNDNLVAYLRETVEPGSTVLDLGCGPKLYSNAVRDLCREILTVDAWSWVEPDVVADLTVTPLEKITDKTWDYILMLDFIEHLDKLAGLNLIEQAKKIVNKKIILLTPMETIWTDNTQNVEDPSLWCYGNQFDVHRSLWTPQDFANWHPLVIAKLEHYFVGYYAP